MWCIYFIFFFKQKTAYEMRISDWSSDVCSSDLPQHQPQQGRQAEHDVAEAVQPPAHQHQPRADAGITAGLGQVDQDPRQRSEERRGGKEWASTCRSRWLPAPLTKQKKTEHTPKTIDNQTHKKSQQHTPNN